MVPEKDATFSHHSWLAPVGGVALTLFYNGVLARTTSVNVGPREIVIGVR